MRENLFQDLKDMVVRYRRRFFKAFLMVLFSNCLLVLNPLVFRQAIIALDPHSATPAGLLNDILSSLMGPFHESLPAWILLLLSISFTSAYFKYKMRIEFISVSRDVERRVRSSLFSRIQSQSMAFYDHHGIGELLSRLTNDISAYRDVLGPGIMYPIFFLSIIIPGLMALFTISPKLTGIALIPLFIIPILNASVRNKIYGLSLKVQKMLADLSNMVQEHYSGIRIVKSYAAENALFRLFSTLCNTLMQLNLRLAVLMGLIFPFFTLVTKLTTIFLVLSAGIIILQAWGELTMPDFISFMWLQSYIFFPVLMLAWVLPVYQRGRAAYDRLREIYIEPAEVEDEASFSKLSINAKSDITFNHLTFRYPMSSRDVLSDINLTIRGGSFVGITGPIGSGKTTLFRLLNREYEIPKGMIFFNGNDIHDYPLEAFSREIVTVEQVPFLFSKTIAENVLFGRDEASLQELELVAKYADLHESVVSFPKGYDTLIGERGVTLSGGQKQRVAMARAFLVNRSILLLDDIFSAVDSSTEKRIFAAIRKNLHDKTILLITHRVSILEQMDRVIYMANGQVLEDGTPAELGALNGHYAALAELQRLSL